MIINQKLAIEGGPKVRKIPLPPRRAFGEPELEMVKQVFENSWQTNLDFGYQGKYEKIFTNKFSEFQGGGFTDAVSSGTAAVYLAVMALGLEKKSDVIVSPATNSGSIMPVAMAGLNIIVPDSGRECFNITPEEFKKAITPTTKAAVLTHLGGIPFDLKPIMEIAHSHNIKIIEDCSQAPGATYLGKKVGTFGDIAALSTMCSKNLTTGGCGGLVYTKNEDYFWKVRYLSDRGRPFNSPNYNQKDTRIQLFPAFNFNQDELSCAIGISTLSKLQETIDKRWKITQKIDQALGASNVVSPTNLLLPEAKPSPFFHTVKVNTEKISVSKKEFARAIIGEGITINPDYPDIPAEWQWLHEYTGKMIQTPNAVDFRNKTFNLLFNERFTDIEVQDIIKAILKVESHYRR